MTMRIQVLLLLAIGLSALSGCAVGPEHRVLCAAGMPVELVEVPFFPQEPYQCGPAALATVLVHSGVDVTAEQLVSRVYVPDRQESLQAEILSATRSHGRVPYVMPKTLAPILTELRAGHPVLLLQNLGIDRWPVWHYAAAVTRWPEEAMAWTALGNVRYLQRDLAAAETAYRRALELSPAFWTACNNLAQTLTELVASGQRSCDGADACEIACGPGP